MESMGRLNTTLVGKGTSRHQPGGDNSWKPAAHLHSAPRTLNITTDVHVAQ